VTPRSLAQRVRDYRYTKGWGPDELASRASISRTALYQIESGKTELPRAGTLQRIALALEVSMERLLGYEEDPKAPDTGSSRIAEQPARKTRRSRKEWIAVDGEPLIPSSSRGPTSLGGLESAFGVEGGSPAPAANSSAQLRERELIWKLHELLASPLGESVGRILDELYRTLPQIHSIA
jgi:transcriptional regulator with XRE-family HTH domain